MIEYLIGPAVAAGFVLAAAVYWNRRFAREHRERVAEMAGFGTIDGPDSLPADLLTRAVISALAGLPREAVRPGIIDDRLRARLAADGRLDRWAVVAIRYEIAVPDLTPLRVRVTLGDPDGRRVRLTHCVGKKSVTLVTGRATTAGPVRPAPAVGSAPPAYR